MVTESDRGSLGSIATPCALTVERETGPCTPTPARPRLVNYPRWAQRIATSSAISAKRGTIGDGAQAMCVIAQHFF